MEDIMLTEIIFSPTGGTKRAADILASALGDEANTMDICDRQADLSAPFDGSDVVIIAVPSYSGRVPSIAAKRIGRFNGNGARAVLLCAYGNRAFDDTLAELADIAERAGFSVVAAVAAVTEHSIVRKYAAGRPNESDRQALSDFGAKIREKMTSGDNSRPFIPGNVPSGNVKELGFVPKTGTGCISCGLCAKKCPTGAIDPLNVRNTDKTKCITCMACVASCPTHARQLSGLVTAAASLKLKKDCSKPKENELFI